MVCLIYLVAKQFINVPDALADLGPVGRVGVLVGQGLRVGELGALGHHLGLQFFGTLLDSLHSLTRLIYIIS